MNYIKLLLVLCCSIVVLAQTEQRQSVNSINLTVQKLIDDSKAKPAEIFTDASGLAWGQSSWIQLNPLDLGYNLSAVKMVSSTTGWAVATDGVIIKTTNSGASWMPQSSNTTKNLFGVSFVDSYSGMAVGSSGTILSTTNGGSSWSGQTSGTGVTLKSISCINANTGFAAGDSGVILKTTNGGTAWTAQNSNTTLPIACINFFSASLGAAVYADTILKTTDGGSTWVKIPTKLSLYLLSIQFIDANTLNAAGAGGCIARSTDGGTTWTTQSIGWTAGLFSISFIDANHGLAVGANGLLLRTTNGGSSWTGQSYSMGSSRYTLQGVSMFDTNRGTAVGSFGLILATTDGGVSWSEQRGSGVVSDIKGGCFTDPLKGMAVSSLKVYKTSSGGNMWDSVVTGYLGFNAVTATDSTHWTIVGDTGKIIQTTNGGTSWAQRTSSTTSNLRAVTFVDANNAFILGTSVIKKTTNAGSTWSSATYPPGASLNTLCFTSATTGWVAGNLGVIYKTTNSGTTWTLQSNTSTYNYTSLYFSDASNGIAIGWCSIPAAASVVSRTTNGGTTWTSTTSQFTYTSLNQSGTTAFISSSTGWFVADSVWCTTDGGSTWASQITPARVTTLSKVAAGSGYVLYAFGYNGVVLVSAISPLTTRTWTGIQDSLWSNPSNWRPTGVPLPSDSIVIPSVSINPVIYGSQQVSAASLKIQSGGKLSIMESLKAMKVLGDVIIYGTLAVRGTVTPYIQVGGNWTVSPGASSDSGFIPGYSAVAFKGTGTFSSGFYNLMLDSSSVSSSVGTISVHGALTNNYSSLLLEHTSGRSKTSGIQATVKDTLFILEDASDALSVVEGTIASGVIYRSISQSTLSEYQFGYPNTFVKFASTGNRPSAIVMSDFPGVSPDTYWGTWVDVPSTVDTVHHAVTASGVTEFGTWCIGEPSGSSKSIAGDRNIQNKPKVQHVVTGTTTGTTKKTIHMAQSGYDFTLSLQYNKSEIPSGTSESSLKLLKLTNTYGAVSVKVIPGGYFDDSINKLRQKDTLLICLADQSTGNIVDSVAAILDSASFTATGNLFNAAAGNYYLVIRHRSSVEVWSALAIAFAKNATTSYDFTDNSSKTYGSNALNLAPGVYGMHGGDINQDGYVDPLDLAIVDEGSFNYLSGRGLAADVNGDGYVDPLDLSIVDQNSYNYVGVSRPTLSGLGKPVWNPVAPVPAQIMTKIRHAQKNAGSNKEQQNNTSIIK